MNLKCSISDLDPRGGTTASGWIKFQPSNLYLISLGFRS